MKRVTLSLTVHPQSFKPTASDRLFYDHWQYCVRFRLSEVSALRDSLDLDRIEQVLNSRQLWRERVRTRWPHNNFVRGHDAITAYTRENLYAFADFLQRVEDPYKMVISVDQCWIYSNNPILLERIGRLPFVSSVKYTRADVVRARGTITLKNPKHEYRSYFRSVKLTSTEKNQIDDFLKQQAVKISPGLQTWINSPFERTQDYFFVDYNGSSWLTMLSLIRPGLIRKTVEIVAK